MEPSRAHLSVFIELGDEPSKLAYLYVGDVNVHPKNTLMSRVLFKKKSPQHTAAFREGHPGLKHGKQAWEDQGDGTRVMRYYNAYLSVDTPWDERWVSSESFSEFESARKVKQIRHYRGERVSPSDDKTVSFEEHLTTAIAIERGKLPEGESPEPVPVIRTEKVGHRPDPRLHRGASGLEAYA